MPRVQQAAPEASAEAAEAAALSGGGPLKGRIEALEQRILHETLHRHGGNKTAAARELGLSRVGLRGKLERYGLGGGRGH